MTLGNGRRGSGYSRSDVNRKKAGDMRSFCRGGPAAGLLRRKLHRLILFLVALLAVSIIAQSVEEISASPASRAATVSIGEFLFNPDPVTIIPGDTVQWDNDGGIQHTATADGGAWNSGLLAPGGSFSQTFNSPGIFPYICTVPGHAALGMVGTIIVVAVNDGNNTLPTAFIGSPNFYETFLTTDSIGFNGAGNDAEDGTLIGASLVWSSNINGPIGKGDSFTASLSPGIHTITLTVTDSNGATGDAIRIINVTAPTGDGGSEGDGGGVIPTAEPTAVSTAVPTTHVPTLEPNVVPTAEPTTVATPEPTVVPTVVPTPEPSVVPTDVPTTAPTPEPTDIPSTGVGGGGGGTRVTVTPAPNVAATPAPAPTPVPVSPGETPVPASPPIPGGGGDGSALPAGATAGIIVAVVAAVSALIYYDVRRRRGRLI